MHKEGFLYGQDINNIIWVNNNNHLENHFLVYILNKKIKIKKQNQKHYNFYFLSSIATHMRI